jgi:hypothetical protein
VLLGPVDLGRTDKVVAATVRARYELDRARAESTATIARALNDTGAQSDLARESSDDRVEAGQLFGLATQTVSTRAPSSRTMPPPSSRATQVDRALPEGTEPPVLHPEFRAGGSPTCTCAAWVCSS